MTSCSTISGANQRKQRSCPYSPGATIGADWCRGSRSEPLPGRHISLPSAALRQANIHFLGSGQGSVSAAGILATLPGLVAEIDKGSFSIDAVARPLLDVESIWNAPRWSNGKNRADTSNLNPSTALCWSVELRRVCSRSMKQAVADLVGPDLRVLFCGINPGKLSGELGLHFARRGNRFWKLLCAGGFTESVLAPEEQHELPALGIGITNLVARATVAASEISVAELREGAQQLEAKVENLRPRCVAVLGLQAYRTAFLRPGAVIGPQPELIGGARLWLLPNPSGLQAHYQLPEMTGMFTALYVATEAG